MPALDVVGDVHGQREALVALGRRLGYDVDGDWAHPEGRVLVFLGDLVDRGPDSLGTAELVHRLVRERRALCLMGNHEYNLVSHRLGLTGPKKSNRPTIQDMHARPDRWAPVLDFFARLPVALDLGSLRLIHAVWHLEHFARVAPVLAPAPLDGGPRDAVRILEEAVVLGSPFDGDRLRDGLPSEHVPPGNDTPFEILFKGFEARSEASFEDAEGQQRHLIRVAWWQDPDGVVPGDGRLVFGHYWNVPPTPGRPLEAVPPHPSGHPHLKAWSERHVRDVEASGHVPLPPETRFVCVDYNGVYRFEAGMCVGAYRHPEHEICWVKLPMPAAEAQAGGARSAAG